MLGDLVLGNSFTYQLYLCKSMSPYEIIACVTDCSYDITLKRQLMNIDELNFTLPYYWNDIDKTINENFDLVKSGGMILLQSYIDDTLKEEQYFYIYQTERNGGEKEVKNVNCYSLEYKLNKIRLRKFSTTSAGDFLTTREIYNNQTFDAIDVTKGGIIDYIIQEKLQNTWSVSYMSSSLVGQYRTFDISDKTILEVIREVEQNFNCIFMFDTINHTMQILDYNDLPNETGLILYDSNYIKQIQEKIKIDEIVTRLYVQGTYSGDATAGGGNPTMSGANPTGQDYVDDFTFFKNTTYMSQSLINALNTYEAKILTKTLDFTNLQSSLATKYNELNNLQSTPTTGYDDLNTNLIIIQNNEDTIIRMRTPTNPSPQANGHDYNYWYAQEQIAKTAVANKQIEINNKQAEIDYILNHDIPALIEDLSYENVINFSLAQRQELLGFINEENVSCSSGDYAELYTFGKAVLAIKAQPPIEFTLNIIDIFNCADENYTWNKLTLGSKIDVIFEDFNIQSKPRITAYTHDFDKNSLSVTVSNKTYFNDDLNYITAIFTKSKQASNTLISERDTYKDYQKDKTVIIDFINSPVDVSSKPIELDQATVILERRGMFMRAANAAQGAMRIMDNKILMSMDNFETFSTAITAEGILCDHLWTLTNTGGSVEINGDAIVCSDMRLDMSTFNLKNRIIIDPTDGIKIQKTISGTPTNVFYVDSSGNLNISGNITMGANSYIDWGGVNSDPDTSTALNTAVSANGTANTANSTANTALTRANQIADGEYAGGTFIQNKQIFSPTILNNKAGLTDTGTTDADIRFWAGDSFNNRASAPFRVSQGGTVTCNNLVITGGSITWANLNKPSAAEIGARADTWIPAKSDLGTWTTYIGSTGIYTGTLIAENINGTYLTGKIIQTASSGARMIISSSGIITYSNGTTKHGISANYDGGVNELFSIYNTGTKLFEIDLANAPSIALRARAPSYGGMTSILESYDGTTQAMGTWNFAGTVTGFNVKFA